jgi:foldase protein PrsA
MRGVLIGLAMAAAAAGGCEADPPQAAASAHAVEEARPAPAPPAVQAATTRPNERAVMAYVDGRPIYMDQLYPILLRGFGLKIAIQLIANELVDQEAGRHGVTVTQADVEKEADEALKRIFGEVAPGQRERLLRQFMQQFRVTRDQWKLSMRRNAILSKLAQRQVVVTDEMLKEEFGRQYGRKVVVRHIQTASWTDAQEVLKRLEQGEDFAELARKVSVSPTAKDGGLLRPIGEKSTWVAPNMRKAAVQLRERGDRSGIVMVGSAFHVLQLDKVIDPQGVALDDVRDKLTVAVRDRQVRARKQQILRRLYEKATKEGRIRYVDPILKGLAEQAAKGTEP